jgi:hypothetical protein
MLPPWSRVLLEKLIVRESNSPPLMGPKDSSLCSQLPATGLYPDPDAFSPHLSTLFTDDPF